MPNLIITNQAKLSWASAQILGQYTLADCWLNLFSGVMTVGTDTTLTELNAVQSTFPGYNRQPVGGWSDVILVGNDAMTEADPVIFECSEDVPQEINGCYATDFTGSKIWFAANFSAPVPVPFNTELNVSIQILFNSIFNL